jgi:uncharacterized protein (TIGR02118 family)
MGVTPEQEGAFLHRRLVLGLGAFSAVAMVDGLHNAARAESSGSGVKLTVLYAKQKDPEAFNKYYLSKHMPLVAKIPGLKRTEVATILPPPADQPEPPYWRITELYFDSVDDLQKAFASEEGKATGADLANFTDKGTVTIFASTIET